MNRRTFLRASTLATMSLGLPLRAAGLASETYTAAIIGRTGGGDYGHGYDRIFNGLPGVTVVAVADPDATGRRKAAERSGARRQYAEYLTMLRQEKPALVSIAPRQPDCHRAMALAALESGAHLFMEKPFTESLVDADAILEVADRERLKILVAHNRRYTSEFVQVRALLQQGLIGTVREVRIQGKQDGRSGGEDLIVLGTHDFDLMRFYFGDPEWCFASVRQDGRDVTPANARNGREPIRVAGDTIHATFGFGNNLVVHWGSVRTGDHWNTRFSSRENWAFEILGTRGIIAYQSGFGFVWLDSPFLAHPVDGPRWQPLPNPGDWPPGEHRFNMGRDLLRAVRTHTSPICSGHDGRWTIAMVSAVYQSHLNRRRIHFPLEERRHPLAPPASP